MLADHRGRAGSRSSNITDLRPAVAAGPDSSPNPIALLLWKNYLLFYHRSKYPGSSPFRAAAARASPATGVTC